MSDLPAARGDEAPDHSDAAARAQQRGSYVGMGAAVLMGCGLALAARSNLALVVAVVATTLVVAVFAHHLGQRVGKQIAKRSLLLALGVGLLSGLASLLCCAICAGLIGLIWAGYDSFRDAYLLQNYLGKPVLAVLAYGLMPASLMGILSGGLLWALSRSLRASQ